MKWDWIDTMKISCARSIPQKTELSSANDLIDRKYHENDYNNSIFVHMEKNFQNFYGNWFCRSRLLALVLYCPILNVKENITYRNS